MSNAPGPFTPFFVGTNSFTYTSTEGADSFTETLDVTVDPTETFAELETQVFQAGCLGSSCHGPGSGGGLRLDLDRTSNFNAVLARVSNVTPENSLILLKPSRDAGTSHSGGTNTGFDLAGDRSRYDRVRRWIQEGFRNN